MNRSESGQPLKFAIVGCGLVGRKRAAAMAALASESAPTEIGATLAYACDLDPQRAAAVAALAQPARAITDFREALADPTVDAVVVATINASLAPVTLAAVRTGKHVLVEKPGALNAAQLRTVLAASAETGARVRLGLNHRFHPALQQARQLVDAGALGPLMFLRGRYGHGGRLGYEREWRADPALSGGGELLDQGVHLIDLARWFLGDFSSIQGHATTSFWPTKVDDNAFLSLRTSAGQTAWLHVSCSEWKNLFSLELYGRDAKLAIDGLGGSYGPERLTLYEMLPEMGPPKTTTFEFPGPDESWSRELREFAADLRLQRPPSPGLPEAIATLEIVEKIYRDSGYPVSTATL